MWWRISIRSREYGRSMETTVNPPSLQGSSQLLLYSDRNDSYGLRRCDTYILQLNQYIQRCHKWSIYQCTCQMCIQLLALRRDWVLANTFETDCKKKTSNIRNCRSCPSAHFVCMLWNRRFETNLILNLFCIQMIHFWTRAPCENCIYHVPPMMPRSLISLYCYMEKESTVVQIWTQ